MCQRLNFKRLAGKYMFWSMKFSTREYTIKILHLLICICVTLFLLFSNYSAINQVLFNSSKIFNYISLIHSKYITVIPINTWSSCTSNNFFHYYINWYHLKVLNTKGKKENKRKKSLHLFFNRIETNN